MADRINKKLSILAAKVKRAVNDWCSGLHVDEIPTPLENLAAEYSVGHLKYAPLFSTGGLTKEEDGFAIYINTEAPGANGAEGTILKFDKHNTKKLKPPIRFTIAHEIVHAIFYKCSGGYRKNTFLHNLDNNSILYLEKQCNELARCILIPKKQLINRVTNLYKDIDSIKNTIDRLNVSTEVFIRRLHLEDCIELFKNTDGFIALCAKNEGRIKIKTIQLSGPNSYTRFIRLRNKESSDNQFKMFQDSDSGGDQYSKDELVGSYVGDVFQINDIERKILSNDLINEKINFPEFGNSDYNWWLSSKKIYNTTFLVTILLLEKRVLP